MHSERHSQFGAKRRICLPCSKSLSSFSSFSLVITVWRSTIYECTQRLFRRNLLVSEDKSSRGEEDDKAPTNKHNSASNSCLSVSLFFEKENLPEDWHVPKAFSDLWWRIIVTKNWLQKNKMFMDWGVVTNTEKKCHCSYSSVFGCF